MTTIDVTVRIVVTDDLDDNDPGFDNDLRYAVANLLTQGIGLLDYQIDDDTHRSPASGLALPEHWTGV